tara:strand:+ start:11973 stop:12467 length:495 start_codon:yes stop_codon:yes gene_type:complete
MNRYEKLVKRTEKILREKGIDVGQLNEITPLSLDHDIITKGGLPIHEFHILEQKRPSALVTVKYGVANTYHPDSKKLNSQEYSFQVIEEWPSVYSDGQVKHGRSFMIELKLTKKRVKINGITNRGGLYFTKEINHRAREAYENEGLDAFIATCIPVFDLSQISD